MIAEDGSAHHVAERDQRQHADQKQQADHVHDGFDFFVRSPARDQLVAQERQPAAVERGERQQVEQAERDRDRREDLDERERCR